MDKQLLHNIATTFSEQAKSLLIKDGSLVPVGFIWNKAGEMKMVPFGFINKEEKLAQLSDFWKFAKEMDATATIILSEAFMTNVPGGEVNIPELKGGKEAITLFISTGTEREMWVVPFTRDPFHFGETKKFSGKQIELLENGMFLTNSKETKNGYLH